MSMSDIKISWDTVLEEGDLSFENNDLVLDSGLSSMVLVSLFTDRRAEPGDTLPDPESTDRRGWWGDETSELEGDRIGSRLWLLNRSKTTQEVLTNAKIYAKEALQWMINEKVAANVEIEVARAGAVGSEQLDLLVRIYKKYGQVVALKFEDIWEGTFNGVS